MNDKEQLQQELQTIYQALNEQDADTFARHYLPEATRFHNMGQLEEGWSEDRTNLMKGMFKAGLAFDIRDIEIADLRIYGNTAIIAGHLLNCLSLPNGQTTEGKMRFSYVWIKQDGEWKEAHHHISDLIEKEH